MFIFLLNRKAFSGAGTIRKEIMQDIYGYEGDRDRKSYHNKLLIVQFKSQMIETTYIHKIISLYKDKSQ